MFLPVLLYAQACCSGGTPLAGNIGIRPMSKADLFWDLTYDYNTQQTLLAGSELLEDNRRKRNTNALLSRVSYAFSDRFALTGIVSWINEKEIVQVANGNNEIAATGIGDAILITQFHAIEEQSLHLLFGAGVKLPIGKFDIRDPETGLLLNPDLQPGSGSFDFLFSARFEKIHVVKDNLAVIVELTTRLNTEANRFEGQQAYQFGREYRVNFGLRDRYLVGSLILDPMLNLLYRRTAEDQISGNEVPNTGGHWVHITPGISWQTSPALSVSLSFGVPVYRNLTGTQLTTTNRFTFIASYQINSKDSFP